MATEVPDIRAVIAQLREDPRMKDAIGVCEGREPADEIVHFYICKACGQPVDKRDLGQVRHGSSVEFAAPECARQRRSARKEQLGSLVRRRPAVKLDHRREHNLLSAREALCKLLFDARHGHLYEPAAKKCSRARGSRLRLSSRIPS